MNGIIHPLPTLITLLAAVLLWLHGPIVQPPHYHDFAAQAGWLGLPRAADVLSNLGFAAVAIWGWLRLDAGSRPGWPGYRLFLLALLLTAFGSAFYHLAPDNARLLWDRLPIALACAGLLAGVRADCRPDAGCAASVFLLAGCAVASVLWWAWTDAQGQGDLRPYLLLQALPLVLVPLWQAIYRAPRAERIGCGIAVALYVAAKAAELHDHQVLALSGAVSGHTLKHLLAAVAAAVLLGALAPRRRAVAAAPAAVLK